MCRCANAFSKCDSLDNSCQNRVHHTNRRISLLRSTCLPTIFEAVDEGKGASASGDESRVNITPLQLMPSFGFKDESGRKGMARSSTDEGFFRSSTHSRRVVLSMGIHAMETHWNMQCARHAHVRSTFPEFFRTEYSMTTTCNGSYRSLQSGTAYHQSACVGRRAGKQDAFEKQLGIAAWLKFFG